MKRNVYLAQISTQYGNSLFLPYSVGNLWAYARTFSFICDRYELMGFLVHRLPIDEVVAMLDNPSVFGFSVYQWNEQYSLALAHAVKHMYPQCVIVFGGPQIPERHVPAHAYLMKHPWINLLVHGEGESTFVQILYEVPGEHSVGHEGAPIPGTSVLDGHGTYVRAMSRERIKDLSILPSPYLAGLFDHLLDGKTDWHATIESHRGCPYSCNFCDWGSATQSKVYAFDNARVVPELDWCGLNRIRFVYSADANYGILKRDVELTQALVYTKSLYEYPKEFRACYAKNSGERIFQIATLLNEAGMSKGITLSVQSLDAHTLQTVNRSNIKIDDFSYWMKRYHEAGISTYTEVIMGLPGETYESFLVGIERLLEAGQHEHLSMYMCQLLPNSEMSDPAYIAKHGIKSVRMPVLLQHSTPQPDCVTEWHDIVVETSTMPQADWERAYMFAWAVQTFHCMGLTRPLAMYLKDMHGVSYRQFYETLLYYASGAMDGVLQEQYQRTWAVMKSALQGKPWDIIDERFGPIIWPTEEASFLALVTRKLALMRELLGVVEVLEQVHEVSVDGELLKDLLKYQAYIVRDPYQPRYFKVECAFDWHIYFTDILHGLHGVPIYGAHRIMLETDAQFNGDLPEFAKHVVWYGRKSGSFFYTNAQEQVLAS